MVTPTSSNMMNVRISQMLEVMMMKKTMNAEAESAAMLVEQIRDIVPTPNLGEHIDIKI